MRSILIVIITAIAFSRAFAGGEVGNGGNVIVCTDSSGNVKSVEVLDYYELRLNGGALSLNPNLVTYQEKLIELFNRWDEVAPKRMEQYKKWLNEFQTDAGIYSGIEIPHIPDTGSIAIPQGCKPISIAFQRADDEIFPGTKRYVINKDLWDYMNETQKAGLVLHELIYREAIKAGHATSLPTRFFNGYLSSATPKGEEYAYIVSKMPLLWVEYGRGIILTIGTLSTDCGLGDNCSPHFQRSTTLLENGKIVEGYVNEVIADFNLNGWHIKFKKQNSPFNSYFKFNQTTGDIESRLDFYEFSLDNKFYFHIKDENRRNNFLRITNNGRFEFDSSDWKDSWFMNNDGTIIRDIEYIDSHNYLVSTSNGNYWRWDYDKKMYIFLDQYFIHLKNTKIECLKKEKDFFECAKLPSSINCKVSASANNTLYVNENLTIKSPRIIINASYPSTYYVYKIFLPKGQVVGYEKILGKLKAIKLTEDSYREIQERENQDCVLASNL